MPIRVFCEICGLSMGVVNIKDIKNFCQKHGERCKKCVKMEDDLKEFIEKKKGHFLNKYNSLAEECRKEMEKEVTNLLAKRAQEEEVNIQVNPKQINGEE